MIRIEGVEISTTNTTSWTPIITIIKPWSPPTSRCTNDIVSRFIKSRSTIHVEGTIVTIRRFIMRASRASNAYIQTLNTATLLRVISLSLLPPIEVDNLTTGTIVLSRSFQTTFPTRYRKESWFSLSFIAYITRSCYMISRRVRKIIPRPPRKRMTVCIIDVERTSSITTVIATIILSFISILKLAEGTTSCSKSLPNVPPTTRHIVAEFPMVASANNHTWSLILMGMARLVTTISIPVADTTIVSGTFRLHISATYRTTTIGLQRTVETSRTIMTSAMSEILPNTSTNTSRTIWTAVPQWFRNNTIEAGEIFVPSSTACQISQPSTRYYRLDHLSL